MVSQRQSRLIARVFPSSTSVTPISSPQQFSRCHCNIILGSVGLAAACYVLMETTTGVDWCPWRVQPCSAGPDELSQVFPHHPCSAVRCGQLWVCMRHHLGGDEVDRCCWGYKSSAWARFNGNFPGVIAMMTIQGMVMIAAVKAFE